MAIREVPISEGHTSKGYKGNRYTGMVTGMCCRVLILTNLLITICYRTTVTYTPPFSVLQSTSSTVKLPPWHVNVFSQLGVKLPQNDGLDLAKHCLRN